MAHYFRGGLLKQSLDRFWITLPLRGLAASLREDTGTHLSFRLSFFSSRRSFSRGGDETRRSCDTGRDTVMNRDVEGRSTSRGFKLTSGFEQFTILACHLRVSEIFLFKLMGNNTVFASNWTPSKCNRTPLKSKWTQNPNPIGHFQTSLMLMKSNWTNK